MIKKIFITTIISILIVSCTSPFSGSGIKFSNRAGNYQNTDKNITVSINSKNKDNLTINISSSINMNETLTVNSASSSQYIRVNSVQYSGHTYILNFGNSVKSFFITVKDDKNQNIVYDKLTIQQ